MSSQAIVQRFRVSRGGCWQCGSDCRCRLAEARTFSQMAYNVEGFTLARAFGGLAVNPRLGGVVLSGGSKVTWLKTHNMAHTILVRLDVGDEYADIHPDITATDHLEGSKAHGWEVVTERVFTESEVRAYGDDLLSAHMSPGQIVERADDYEEPLYRWIDRAIKAVNAKHGLSDPA